MEDSRSEYKYLGDDVKKVSKSVSNKGMRFLQLFVIDQNNQ